MATSPVDWPLRHHFHLPSLPRLAAAADSCAEAFKSWRTTPVSTRARVMFLQLHLVRSNFGEGCHPKNPNVSPKTRCRLNLVKGDCCRNANTIDWIFVACDYVESERCFLGSVGQIWTDQVVFSNLSTALVASGISSKVQSETTPMQ